MADSLHNSLANSASDGSLHNLHLPGYSVADVTAMNAISTGSAGDLAYVQSSGSYYAYTGSAWLPLSMGGAASGDMTWSVIQASQLVNEVKGWPSVVNTGDLDALNLWWDKVGTPTTAPSVVTTSGESLTQTWTYCLKCVTDASAEGLSQTWTYADEPRMKSGRVCSAILAIWSVSSVSVTAKLVNSDASETAASATTAAAWTIVTIENHTLAGTSCNLQVTTGAAGTFYVVPLGVCIGAKAVPLGPRPLRYVDAGQATVVNNVDPGGADFTDADFTSVSSNLAAILNLHGYYNNGAGASKNLFVRRNGDTNSPLMLVTSVTNVPMRGNMVVPCDDGQIIEYKTGAGAGEGESVYLQINGYWEWA